MWPWLPDAPSAQSRRPWVGRFAIGALIVLLGLIVWVAWRGYSDPLMPIMLTLMLCV